MKLPIERSNMHMLSYIHYTEIKIENTGLKRDAGLETKCGKQCVVFLWVFDFKPAQEPSDWACC